MAFERSTPEDLQERFGCSPRSEADGEFENAILGGNGARLYGVDPNLATEQLSVDSIEAMKRAYSDRGISRRRSSVFERRKLRPCPGEKRPTIEAEPQYTRKTRDWNFQDPSIFR